MAYIIGNPKTKKAAREAIAAGRKLQVFQPGPFDDGPIQSGTVYLEGPHFPKPHRWYAEGVMVDGFLVSIK